MAAALALTLLVAAREKLFFEANQIISPDVPLAPVTLYFFGVVAVMAIVLFFIPLKWLKYVFKVLFTLMFGFMKDATGSFTWGFFVLSLLALAAYILITKGLRKRENERISSKPR